MFNSIDYSVTFETTGQTFARRHDFARGLTSITGANEQGKSLILEFLRFMMFGSAALRGPASDYGTLKVEGEVVIQGETYQIERSITKAKLTHNGAVIVTGTKPVNLKIVSLLGFGLDVFDVANSINQGEVERLGSMRPADRQRLVDSVVGLDKIEALTKMANDKALGFEREAAGIERVLWEPEAPVEPECWPNRVAMIDFLKLAEKDAAELAGVEGELRAPRLAPPVAPVPYDGPDMDTLVASLAARRSMNTLDAELANLPAPIDMDATRAAIAAYEDFAAAELTLRQNPQPLWANKGEIEALLADWALIDEWTSYDRLKTEREKILHTLEHADKSTCPACAHQFPLNPALFDKLQQRATDLASLVKEPLSPLPTTPKINQASAETILANWDKDVQAVWDRRAAALSVPQAPPPAVRAAELPRYEAAALRRPELQAERIKIATAIVENDQELAIQCGSHSRALEAYAPALAAYDAQVLRILYLEAQREGQLYAPARVAELRPIVAAFAPHEAQLARYTLDKATYDTRRGEMAKLMTSGAEWRRAKDALTTLRTSIKQHLYPSLAKAASFYITGMTGGQRRKVEIDDGFEILIDGQRLDSLSGSGKAVANLAIRLGLGRVLTHSVFPVVLADEIDASMDDYRAEKTADILQQCAMSISQLLLVSHKTPLAENYLSLGDNSEQPHTTQ